MLSAEELYTQMIEQAKADLKEINRKIGVHEMEISDLEEERDEVKSVLAYSTSKLEAMGLAIADHASADSASGGRNGFAGLTTAEAVATVLEDLGPPALKTRELIVELRKRGWTTSAGNAYLSVFGSLSRHVKSADSKLEKVADSRWALKRWSAAEKGLEDTREPEEHSGTN